MIRKIVFRIAAAMFAVMAMVAPAAAQTDRAAMSVSFDLGMLAAGTGNVHSGGTGTVLDLPTIVNARSYGDVFGSSVYWAAGLGFRVAENGEVRVSVNYAKDRADRLQVGSVAGLDLFGQFGDYKAFGIDAGYRQYVGTGVLRPFVGGSAGFVRLAKAPAEFTVPAAGVTLSDVDFFASSTVPAFAVGVGVQMDLSAKAAFQAGIDFKWHGAYGDVDGLAGTGLEAINDRTSRWAMPITAGITFRF